MTATSATQATRAKAASSRHAVLEELIGIALRHAGEQYLDLASRLAGALIDGDDGDTRLIQRRIRAGNQLRNRNFAFLHLATTTLEQALRREMAALAPAARTGEQALSLVPLEEMDSKLALAACSKPFDSLHADALQTLNARLAVVLGRDMPRLSQNPFRPAVFIEALQQAWRDFDPEQESADLLHPWIKPGMFIALGPMLEALNLALQGRGVLPGPVRHGRRQADGGAGAPPRTDQAALRQRLRRLFGDADAEAASAAAWTTPAGHGNGAAERQARQPLLAYLDELQKAVPYESIGNLAAMASGAGRPAPAAGGEPLHLSSLKQAVPQGSLSRADESAIDLLSAVFDTVFRDPGISPEIRELIRFLQIPVLKAALADKNFFFQDVHPARRLLDLLSRMGWEQRRGPDDPLFQAMRRGVDRIGRDQHSQPAVFAEAVDELEAQIMADENAATAAIAAPIAAALRQEKMAESTRQARDAVALRIGTGEVIAVVEAFLEQRWVAVLTIAYRIEDDKPGAIHSATRTMDDLIWSVRPKPGAEERKQLIARLPGMLAALRQWLDVIQWRDADRLRFFTELAECHASIVRAPLELSPERQVEIALQVAQRAAERRLQWQARAEAAAQQRAADGDDEAASEVAGLARGMWLAFDAENGASRKVKLAWISPRRTLYIFSTAARQEAFSLSGEALTGRIRAGSARVVLAEGVVAAALSQALSQGIADDA